MIIVISFLLRKISFYSLGSFLGLGSSLLRIAIYWLPLIFLFEGREKLLYWEYMVHCPVFGLSAWWEDTTLNCFWVTVLLGSSMDLLTIKGVNSDSSLLWISSYLLWSARVCPSFEKEGWALLTLVTLDLGL